MSIARAVSPALQSRDRFFEAHPMLPTIGYRLVGAPREYHSRNGGQGYSQVRYAFPAQVQTFVARARRSPAARFCAYI